ncbi:hypothetical protein HYT04_01975 [Candidatus Kaiserbacteria bacterium]|nr:hypothetical protein [Candidatus Kaiserbacteria bacterium]
MKPEEKEISQDIVNLVVTRLESLPRNMKVSIGALEGIGGSYSVSELIDSVRKQNAVGKQMVDIQMAYLRNFSRRSSLPGPVSV